MYEMYPQAWGSDEAAPSAAPQRPRRRPRKEHSVLPAVLIRHADAELRRPGR